MDLDAHLLDLLGAAPGDQLFPGVRLVRVSSGSGWRATVRAGDVEVHLEIEPLDPARRHAARTAKLAVSYRLARTGPPLDDRLALRLCAALAHRIAAREDAVLERLAAEAASVRQLAEGGTRVREVRAGRALEPMGTDGERFHGLSPYAGCVIGCRFCYAHSRLRPVRRLQLLDEAPWGSYVDVRIDVPERLAEELRTEDVRAIKLCPILSDPYQPVEARYGLTRSCLEVLRDAEVRVPVLVLTRSTLIARDAALLAEIPGALAGASVPTADDEVRRHFEPRSAAIDARFETLRTLRAAGVRTFAIVQPLLPGSLEVLADRLAATVESVRIDVLYGVEGASREFADPRFAEAASDGWQRERAGALAGALRERGVAVWGSELPPAR